MDDEGRFQDATLAIHGGDPGRAVGLEVTPSPVLSSSFFSHPDTGGFSSSESTEGAAHFYTRWGNPTLEILEKRLALLEGGEAAVSFGSGMAALSGLMLHRLRGGDHLVLSNVCYAGMSELALDTLPKYGIETTTVDTSDPAAVAQAIRPNTRLVHIETPGNPILRLTDIAAIAEVAHARVIELSVDSTIATPLGQKPLALGADYVVHSLTKYLSGHGDALGGAVIGRATQMAPLRKDSLVHLGGVLSPFTAWLVLRGLETLSARMALHEANARRVEVFLAEHPKVRRVFWPGSLRHPQHELARRQMRNFSGLLSFTVKADSVEVARALAERLRIFSYAVSLGKTRSLIFYIPTENLLRTSFRLEGEEALHYREWAGEGVFRVSAGLEDADDLIADLAQALA